MHAGRQADSAPRRQRVITAINQATSNGTEISVSGIARTAVNRASTAPSSTGTATCSSRSTPSKQPRPRLAELPARR